jgi:hypothetical protein
MAPLRYTKLGMMTSVLKLLHEPVGRRPARTNATAKSLAVLGTRATTQNIRLRRAMSAISTHKKWISTPLIPLQSTLGRQTSL